MRKRKSVIWLFPKSELEIIVKESNSLNQILIKIGSENSPTSYRALKVRLAEESITYDHISLGRSHNKGKIYPARPKIPTKQILVVNSTFSNRTNLKDRLIKENLFKDECYVCGIKPEWCEKYLSLQVDHINGIGNDNRLENLRLLCPNCHSQTDNFSGKKNKITKESK